MLIKAVTIDSYKEFQYIIPKRLSSHQSPYVKVRWQGVSVAYILLKSKEVVFYETTPNEVITQKNILETWISKNFQLCKKVWNDNNEVKI